MQYFDVNINSVMTYYIVIAYACINLNDLAIISLEIQKEKRGVPCMTVKRGDMYYADLSPVVGSEQGGVRPVLIIQNDVGNKYSPTVIAAAITSQTGKSRLPTHININSSEYGLMKNSVILTEQIRTIDKSRLLEKIGQVDPVTMHQVNSALNVSFGLI